MMKYPTWFEVALNELEYDYEQGYINTSQYEDLMNGLWDELEEYEESGG